MELDTCTQRGGEEWKGGKECGVCAWGWQREEGVWVQPETRDDPWKALGVLGTFATR